MSLPFIFFIAFLRRARSPPQELAPRNLTHSKAVGYEKESPQQRTLLDSTLNPGNLQYYGKEANIWTCLPKSVPSH